MSSISRRGFVLGGTSAVGALFLTACAGSKTDSKAVESQVKEIKEPVATSDYIAAVQNALETRWAMGEIADNPDDEQYLNEFKVRVQAELGIVERYYDKKFADENIVTHAQAYTEALQEMKKILSEYPTFREHDFNDEALKRSNELKYFVVSCDLSVSDEYKDTLDEVLSQADSDGKDHIDEFVISKVERADALTENYFDLKVTLTNNTDTPKYFQYFEVQELDADGNILNKYDSENKNASYAMVDPGQGFTIKLTEDAHEGIAALKSTYYAYKLHEEDDYDEIIKGKFSDTTPHSF